jgi:hypothetical protein
VSHIATGLLLLKPWPDFGSTADAARVGVGDFADRLERVEVEDGDPCALAAAGDVEPPPDRIGEDVVEPARFLRLSPSSESCKDRSKRAARS